MDNRHIVITQATAAILMGVDYFTPKYIRESISSPLRDYFSGTRIRSISHFYGIWEYSLRHKWRSFYPFLYLSAATVVFHDNSAKTYLTTHLSAFILIPFLTLVLVSIFLAMNFFNHLLLCLVVSLPIAGVALFLEKSERGPLAAIGFLILMTSFLIRYTS